MKEIYKMNILEEIIPILVLKWYFKIWICKVWEQGFRSWFKGPQQRQWGISGRWRIWRKSRWTDFWFRRDTIVRNFIHWCQRRASLLFEDYWKRDFRWNSYGYLESCSTCQGYDILSGTIWNPFAHEPFPSNNSIYCLCLLS